MRTLETFKATFEPVDLTPRGTTVVNLLGESTPNEYPGCSHASHIPENVRDPNAPAEAEAVAARCRTKAEAVAVLSTLGVEAWPGEKLADLKVRIRIELHDRWYPRVFVNAAVLKPGHVPCKYGCHSACYVK